MEILQPTTAQVLKFWFQDKHPNDLIFIHQKYPSGGFRVDQALYDPVSIEPQEYDQTRRYVRMTSTTSLPIDKDGYENWQIRGGSGITGQIHGLALDVDVAKDPKYPQSSDDLNTILNTPGFPLMHYEGESRPGGAGRHWWFSFDRPLPPDEGKQLLAEMSKAVRRIWQHHGFEIDHRVAARIDQILVCPGTTLNGEPINGCLHTDRPRYDPYELRDRLNEIAPPPEELASTAAPEPQTRHGLSKAERIYKYLMTDDQIHALLAEVGCEIVGCPGAVDRNREYRIVFEGSNSEDSGPLYPSGYLHPAGSLMDYLESIGVEPDDRGGVSLNHLEYTVSMNRREHDSVEQAHPARGDRQEPRQSDRQPATTPRQLRGRWSRKEYNDYQEARKKV